MAIIETVRTTDSRVDPEAVAKVKLDGGVSPTEVVAGDALTVRGGIKNPSSVYRPQVRIVVESKTTGVKETVDLGYVTTGGKGSFSANLGQISSGVGSVAVDIKVQSRPFSYLGWSTTDTAAVSVNVVTEGQARTNRYFDYLPYVVGGGGAGYAISNATGRDPRRGMVAGGATGAFMKRYAPDVSVPSFPTGEVALIAAVLIGGGYFLSSAGDTIPLLGQ